MADTLYAGHQGLARYPSQQVLYQWNKQEQLAALPHAAFIGQGDMRANGDCWIICKAGGALARGDFFKAPAPIEFTQPLKKAFVAGEYHIRMANDNTTAITADQFAEASLSVYSTTAGHPTGLTNRIMGNTPAAAASGTTYPEFRVELEYPFETAIPVAADIKITPHLWNGVEAPDAAADDSVVGWSPIAVTSGYYFWAKIAGDVTVKASAAILVGQAVTVLGTTTAGDVGSVAPTTAAAQQVGIAREALLH